MELSVGRFEDLVRGDATDWSAVLFGAFQSDPTLERRLRRMGGGVRRASDAPALGATDLQGIAVVDCDGMGGVEAACAALPGMRARAGAILIGAGQEQPEFSRTPGPDGAPLVRLRAPVSGLALRLGLEFVLGRRIAGW